MSCVAINGPLSTRSAVAYRVVEMMEIKCGLNAVMFFVFCKRQVRVGPTAVFINVRMNQIRLYMAEYIWKQIFVEITN